MDMSAIIARAELTGAQPAPDNHSEWRKASATLDALVSYMDAICAEWAATPEVDRLAAARLAADTARRIQAWVGSGLKGEQQ
ncbi:MAG: hypothetical protein QOH48_488 [Actinomycetota bacterium]|jgi:hypothetical protein|nr:hypothetical protein [Actinomycetota bacterium]